jgi:two-component system chemotaxis response regulator CheB
VISVLVVDDSVVVRRLVVDALSGGTDINVVGTAANGRLAQNKIDQLRPDVVTMDIEMPEMNGIEAVRELRKRHPRLPVIMFSTLTAAGATATLDALAAGASDYVTKPANVGSVAASIQAVRDQLVPRILALGGRSAGTRPAGAGPAGPAAPGGPPAPGAGRPSAGPLRPPPAYPPSASQVARPTAPAGGSTRPAAPAAALRPGARVDVLAVGCSTGGPDALAQVVAGLPGDLPVPVVVVQHMPPVFTRMFAERLDRTSQLTVVEAADGTPAQPGTVLIAPGDKHLTVVRRGTSVVARLTDGPPENSCRPAVDVLFRSVAAVYGANAVATVLTGMGRDGRKGCEVMRAAGAGVVVQDEASSVVWGMPGAVATAGLADAVLPLNDIASVLLTRVNAGRSPRPKVVTR